MPETAQTGEDVALISEDASTNAVKVITATKEPPLESSHAILTRRFILMSFWFISLCLGLPLWWKTTTVYRASLPLDLMGQWADGKVGLSNRFNRSSR